MRAAVATVVPLALAVERARPELAWMALGGWLGTLADPGGSRSSRARPLVAFGLGGAVVVAATEAVGRSLAASVAVVTAIAFGGAMLAAFGSAASTVGSMLAIVAAIGVSSASPEPVRDAAWFAAGGGAAVVLSSVVWPVWTHLAVRRAAGEVFGELARYAAAVVAAADDPSDEAWAALGRRHARPLRDAIERARAASLAVRSRRSGESPMGSNLRVLLGMAESQFLVLVAAASELEAARAASPATDARAALATLAETYDAIRARLVARAWSPRAHEEAAAPRAGDGALGALVAELVREGDAAAAVADALDREGTRAVAESAPLGEAFAQMRDALASRSSIVRHAIRVAVVAAAATLAGMLLFRAHAAWVIVTALVVVRADAGATVKRAAERVAGTVLGGLLASAINAARPGPIALAAIMFPLSIAAVVTRPRSYRLFTFFLTPIFVLIAMQTPGDWAVAVERGVDTVAGGAIALVAAFAVFPRWHERVDLPSALAEMVRASRAYAKTVVQSLGVRDATALARIADARLRTAAANGHAEELFERLLIDPLRSREREARAMELVTLARRLSQATTTLDTLAARSAPTDAALARVRRYATLLRRTSPSHRAAVARAAGGDPTDDASRAATGDA